MSADLILRNGRFTTLERSNPTATAVAIIDGVFTAVGRDQDVMSLASPSTRVIDLGQRRALPGLIDNHLHVIRGGLNFNMELRWVCDLIRSVPRDPRNVVLWHEAEEYCEAASRPLLTVLRTRNDCGDFFCP